MAENIRASETVLKSEKIIGSANPIARGFRKFKNSIAGVFSGCIMVVLGIVLIVLAVKIVKNNAKVVASIPVSTPEQAEKKNNELVKVQAKPTILVPAKLEYRIKDLYNFEETHTFNEDAVYFDAQFQIYEQVEETTQETRTVIKDGKEVEQTIEKREVKEKWVTKKEISSFASFKLGNIDIDTKDISTKFDTLSTTIDDVVIPDGASPTVYENPSSKVGSTRLIINYVPADHELIVVGKIHNNRISGGEVFLITNKTNDDLVKTLKTEENIARWGIRFLAWLFLTLGFTALVGPVLTLLSFIPFVGKATNSISCIFFGILSAIIVLAVTFFVVYWWVFVLCLVLLMAILFGLGIYLVTKKK